jgi:hypothetical protein
MTVGSKPNAVSMAQAQIATMSPVGGQASMMPTEDELHQIQQCERIVQFRDAVMSGSHPRIKVPPHLAGKLAPSTSRAVSSPNLPPPSASLQTSGASQVYQLGNLQSFASNSQRPAITGSSTASAAGPSHGPKPFGSGATAINPVLLEKSDDLIRAEIQLQRQKLERSLREEMEQRRTSMKTSLQAAESLADFDLSDVLSKALSLVQAAAAPGEVTNTAAASDSFDENSFYSSRHDTPYSNQSSQGRDDTLDVQMLETSASQQSLSAQIPTNTPGGPPPAAQVSLQEKVITHDLEQQGQAIDPPFRMQSHNPPAVPRTISTPYGAAPMLNNARDAIFGGNESTTNGGPNGQGSSSLESGVGMQSEDSGNMDTENSADQNVVKVQAQSLPTGPVVRAHDLSPVAPQPAHVSPLAVARRHPGAETESVIPQGTPLQVSALRVDPVAGTSPESSPQNGVTSSKKKSKKKKRKADRQAPDTAAAPYIKPEPRSPSPFTAPPYARPNKRHRQAQRPMNEVNYEDHRYGPVWGAGSQQGYVSQPSQEERVPAAYERQDELYPRPPTQAFLSGGPRYEREYLEDGRTSGSQQYVRRPQSPTAYPAQHAPIDGHRTARSVSQVVIDRTYGEAPRYYRDDHEYARMSIRPDTARARSRSPVLRERQPMVMGPPKPPTVIVDATGREYFEPPRPPLIRQSVAPAMRSGEPEIIYERAPLLATSTRPGAETYEDGGLVYLRSPTTYGVPRRVVTQPEYGAPDYRAYRQRDYSARPIPPLGEEYIQVRAGPERRLGEEAAREYISRAASVRPVEPIRYDMPRGYERVQSVRPDLPTREYASSVHPESHRPMGEPFPQGYGGRPVESPVVRREYSVRPVEQYYNRPPPGQEDMTYVERPGVTQEIVYGDDARREVYR